jgi:hypothetical protein
MNEQKQIETMQAIKALTLDKITAAYSGKAGKCCCGCSGHHYHAKNHGDYRGGGTKNDLRQIARIFKLVQQAAVDGFAIEIDSTFASATVEGRWYNVYFE